MRRRFVELVGWKSGYLSFTHGALSNEDTMPEAFNAVELIARGITEGYTYEDLAKIMAPLEDALIVPVPRAAVSVSQLKLAPRVVRSRAGSRRRLEGERRCDAW